MDEVELAWTNIAFFSDACAVILDTRKRRWTAMLVIDQEQHGGPLGQGGANKWPCGSRVKAVARWLSGGVSL